MKKSIVIILIILFGFSSLCYSEISDDLVKEYPLTELEYILLKVEMDIRDDIVFSDGRPRNVKFTTFLTHIIWIPQIRRIYTEYFIDTTNYFNLTPVEKEIELTKLIDLTILKIRLYDRKIDKNDFIIIFTGEGKVEVSTFKNGKLTINK